jgi:hypothetical protein
VLVMALLAALWLVLLALLLGLVLVIVPQVLLSG